MGLMMFYGVLAVGALGFAMVLKAAPFSKLTKKQLATLAQFKGALQEAGGLSAGTDFLAVVPEAAAVRAKLLRPRAALGEMARWQPHAMAGQEGHVSLAIGIDGVIVEVCLEGIALLRELPMRIGPPTTAGDASDTGQRCASGDPAFDLAYSIFANDPDAVKRLASQTNLPERARAVLTTGGILIDGAGGTLRVAAALPLNVDNIARFTTSVMGLAACLDVDVSHLGGLGGLGAIGGTSGSPFALPSA